MFLGTLKRTSIRSAVFARLSRMTYRLTDGGISNCNSPHLMASIWPKSRVFKRTFCHSKKYRTFAAFTKHPTTFYATSDLRNHLIRMNCAVLNQLWFLLIVRLWYLNVPLLALLTSQKNCDANSYFIRNMAYLAPATRYRLQYCCSSVIFFSIYVNVRKRWDTNCKKCAQLQNRIPNALLTYNM